MEKSTSQITVGVHELPSEESCLDISSGSNIDKGGEQSSEAQVVVDTALVARIEALEAETCNLHSKLSKTNHSTLDWKI